MIFPLFVSTLALAFLLKTFHDFNEMMVRKSRAERDYRREVSLRAERQDCVRFIISHGTSIEYREPYELLVKKMDGDRAYDLYASMLKMRTNALAHARRRLREIGAELGDTTFPHLSRERP